MSPQIAKPRIVAKINDWQLTPRPPGSVPATAGAIRIFGRVVVQKTPLSGIRVLFETVNPIPNSPSNFDAAPTQVLPVVRLGAECHSAEGKLDQEMRRSLDLLRWSLIPYGAKDAITGPRCINPMTETVATKPPFRGISVAIVGV